MKMAIQLLLKHFINNQNSIPMKRNSIFALTMLTLLMIQLFSGCAGRRYLTTEYSSVEKIPDGKAVVYIYRVKALGTAVHYTVNADKKPVSDLDLYLKGYLVYYADPGETTFWAEIEGSGHERTKVTIDIQEGKSYYIEGSVKMGAAVGGPHLEHVSKEEGRKEIQKCKLIAEKE